MATTNQTITGVDFVSIATRDFEAALEFYGTSARPPRTAMYGRSPGAEFETGNLTLQILESEAFGMTFQTDNHPIAFHVDDVSAARAELESRGESRRRHPRLGRLPHGVLQGPGRQRAMLHHRYAPKTPAG